MAFDVDAPGDDVLAFLRERHLAILTTMRSDGSPHLVPIGFGYDPESRIARIITSPGSQKAVNAGNGGRAAVSQVDGGRWLTLEGTISVVTDTSGVARAVAAYTERYQAPRERSDRVALELTVDRIMGRA